MLLQFAECPVLRCQAIRNERHEGAEHPQSSDQERSTEVLDYYDARNPQVQRRWRANRTAVQIRYASVAAAGLFLELADALGALDSLVALTIQSSAGEAMKIEL